MLNLYTYLVHKLQLMKRKNTCSDDEIMLTSLSNYGSAHFHLKVKLDRHGIHPPLSHGHIVFSAIISPIAKIVLYGLAYKQL